MKALLTNYRQSPRKVRIVADTVRGKRVPEALQTLSFLPKRASGALSKLIASAAANAAISEKKNQEDLVVSEITVTKGRTLKRFRPRSRGMAHRINKRNSNVRVVLAEVSQK